MNGLPAGRLSPGRPGGAATPSQAGATPGSPGCHPIHDEDTMHSTTLEEAGEHLRSQSPELPVAGSPPLPPQEALTDDEFQFPADDLPSSTISLTSSSRRFTDRSPEDPLGAKGLKNPTGANNCFLNVVLQSLWHLPHFREAFNEVGFSRRDAPETGGGAGNGHANGRPLRGHHCEESRACMVCAIDALFREYRNSDAAVLNPRGVRQVLIALDREKYQAGLMADAGETFEAIAHLVHCTTSGLGLHSEALCAPTCVVHEVFGTKQRFWLRCPKCPQKELLTTWSCVTHVPAQLLVDNEKRLEYGLLLRRAMDLEKRTCDCGQQAHVTWDVLAVPRVMALGVVWKSHRATRRDVAKMLATIRCDFAAAPLWPGRSDPTFGHLTGVVVYYGLHFVAYFWSPQGGCWVQFDDGAVREVAKTWRGLCELLVTGRRQPQVLFYSLDDHPEGPLPEGSRDFDTADFEQRFSGPEPEEVVLDDREPSDDDSDADWEPGKPARKKSRTMTGASRRSTAANNTTLHLTSPSSSSTRSPKHEPLPKSPRTPLTTATATSPARPSPNRPPAASSGRTPAPSPHLSPEEKVAMLRALFQEKSEEEVRQALAASHNEPNDAYEKLLRAAERTERAARQRNTAWPRGVRPAPTASRLIASSPAGTFSGKVFLVVKGPSQSDGGPQRVHNLEEVAKQIRAMGGRTIPWRFSLKSKEFQQLTHVIVEEHLLKFLSDHPEKGDNRKCLEVLRQARRVNPNLLSPTFVVSHREQPKECQHKLDWPASIPPPPPDMDDDALAPPPQKPARSKGRPTLPPDVPVPPPPPKPTPGSQPRRPEGGREPAGRHDRLTASPRGEEIIT